MTTKTFQEFFSDNLSEFGWSLSPTDIPDVVGELTDEFYALDGGPEVVHIGNDMQIEGGPGIRHGMLQYALKHELLPC